MKDNVNKLNAWYGLQIRFNDEWISISGYDTLEAARKAVRVRTENYNYKGEKLRIVKITVTMEVVE